jgi:hypothetical protein
MNHSTHTTRATAAPLADRPAERIAETRRHIDTESKMCYNSSVEARVLSGFVSTVHGSQSYSIAGTKAPAFWERSTVQTLASTAV